jgi:hypothetical protein
MHTKYEPENKKERDYLRDVGVDGVVLLTRKLKEYGIRPWIGFK